MLATPDGDGARDLSDRLQPITELLAAWGRGEEAAKDRLFDLLYEDIRRLAREQRARWSGAETLSATALVHELYARLGAAAPLSVEDRRHFVRLVSRVLRHILVDYARSRNRLRRGGSTVRIRLEDAEEAELLAAQSDEVLAIHDALTDLSRVDERLARVVELRFFGGLTHDEIAETLGLTKRTITRDWAKAKGWLRRDLGPGGEG